MKKYILLLVISIVLFSCSSEKKQALTPGCDATIYYSTDIVPILEAKCLSCHSGTPTYMSGPDMSDYNSQKAMIDNGRFYDRVFTRRDMPMAGFPQLTDSEKNKLKCLLDQGARNN